MNGLVSLEIECPYCGESVEALIDTSVETQSYVEDCEVCCRPMNFYVEIDENGDPLLQVTAEDE